MTLGAYCSVAEVNQGTFSQGVPLYSTLHASQDGTIKTSETVPLKPLRVICV